MHKVGRTEGFTLVEAVISLAVLLGTSVIIQLVVQTSQRLRPMELSSCANWYLFVAELESSKHQFSLQKMEGNHLVLKSGHNDKTYWLCENQTIYLRGPKGGYLPVLTDYQPHTLQMKQLDQRRVEVSAQTKDGQRQYANICFSQKTRQRYVDSHYVDEHHDGHHRH